MSLRKYNHLSPERQPGESHENYRARRHVINRAIKTKLRGALAYTSSEALRLPPVGEDEKIDEALQNDRERGRVRDFAVIPVGTKTIRVCRTKGVSRVHPSKKLNPGMKRAERRALYRRNEWREIVASEKV